MTAFAMPGFTRHERRVLSPLVLTGFFETYDVALLTLAAPVLAHGLGLSIGVFGICVALIRLASLASVPVLRLADRWGRRTLLLVSLAAFTIATGMTALALGVVAFVLVQMVARVFQATESSLAGLVIAEELRPHRRGAGRGEDERGERPAGVDHAHRAARSGGAERRELSRKSSAPRTARPRGTGGGAGGRWLHPPAGDPRLEGHERPGERRLVPAHHPAERRGRLGSRAVRGRSSQALGRRGRSQAGDLVGRVGGRFGAWQMTEAIVAS